MASTSTGSRSRPQARKRANDDSPYFGPPVSSGPSGTKRQATDKADGEPRVKRKRVDAVVSAAVSNKKDITDGDQKPSMVLTSFEMAFAF